jgi:hypothetical protein
MNMEKQWREFELLVARLERLLAPEGATVKSPDRIQDKITGTLREVDASIRCQIGTVPILITIECRDRSGVQDVTWIEQLASKRDNIGAAKTIAVTSSNFTGPAVELARHKGIELRQISDVTDQEIKGLVVVTEIENCVFRTLLKDVAVNVDGDEPASPLKFTAKVQELISNDKMNAPVFIRCSDGKALSVGNMIDEIKSKKPEIFYNVPEDGSKVRRTIRANMSHARFTIEMETGPVQLKGVDLTLELFSEKIRVPISKFIAYSDETRRLLIAGEARAIIMGETVVFTAFHTPGLQESPLAISVEPGSKLHPISVTLSP